MRSSVRLGAIVILLCVSGSGLAAQRGAIAGVIVARETGQPLAYGTVAIPALDREQFTSDAGRFLIGDLPEGTMELRVRRLGYRPVSQRVEIRAGVIDTIRVALERVALPLDRVTVRSWPPCRSPGVPDSAANPALAAALEQLRLNAEQFRLLSREYPFTYVMERLLSARMRESGKLALTHRDAQAYSSEGRWEYRPGQVLRRRGRTTTFRIPTIAVLSDERFLAAHCFHYAGLDMVDSVEMVRIDLVADESIDNPDVNGSMFLDPVTYQIRRTELFLSKRDRRTRWLAEMRVVTDFGEIMPSIPIIVEVNSVQLVDPEEKSDIDESRDEQRLVHFEFRDRRPGG